MLMNESQQNRGDYLSFYSRTLSKSLQSVDTTKANIALFTRQLLNDSGEPLCDLALFADLKLAPTKFQLQPAQLFIALHLVTVSLKLLTTELKLSPGARERSRRLVTTPARPTIGYRSSTHIVITMAAA